MVSELCKSFDENLQGIMKEVLSSNRIFKDINAFDSQYIPSELPSREGVILELSSACKPIFVSNNPHGVCIAVTGGSGTGKTATTRYFGQLLTQISQKKFPKILCVYYNCHMFRNLSAILHNLLQNYFNQNSRGYSNVERMGILFQRLKGQRQHLLLILDEAEILGLTNILGLIHAGDGLPFKNSHLSTILVGRGSRFKALMNTNLIEHVDYRIELPHYTREALVKILASRVKSGLKLGVVSGSILELIGNIASESGSARVAVELLRRAGINAERARENTLTVDMIHAARNSLWPQVDQTTLNSLKPHELLLVFAVAARLNHKGITFTTLAEVYYYYCVKCKKLGVTPLAKISTRKNLEMIRQIGIIDMEYRTPRYGRGRRGRIFIPNISVRPLLNTIGKRIDQVERRDQDKLKLKKGGEN